MNSLLFPGFLLLFFNLSAQTDTVVNGVKYNYFLYYPDGKPSELGNVRDHDNVLIKNGHWLKYDVSGNVIESGQYQKGKKTGTWQEGECRGGYKNGKKQGWWKCPDRKNKYDNGEFMEKILKEHKVF